MEVIGFMFGESPGASTRLHAAQAELDTCDGYVVLVVDPQTEEIDAHGPFDGITATHEAAQRRAEFDGDGLGDVQVAVVRLHVPAESRSATGPAPRRVRPA